MSPALARLVLSAVIPLVSPAFVRLVFSAVISLVSPALVRLVPRLKRCDISGVPFLAPFQVLIAPAVDRAIRDIIQRVVEHSVTIACTTARDLVSKDYITEPGKGSDTYLLIVPCSRCSYCCFS